MAPKINDDVAEAEDMDFVSIQPISLEVQWTSEYPSYDETQQVIYANCNIKAPACTDEERKPVDVVVVLDRSGSMAGQKLDLCLKTIQFLTNELSPNDRLSIVSYDTNIRTDVPLTKMDQRGKLALEMALPKIRAGSATNLSGGLFQGLQEIQNEERNDGEAPNAVKSVLLLTDGLANHGVTSVSELTRMVSGMLHEDVSLFTFGYGAHHNEDLLRSLSDVGRGVYYFVENIDGVSLAFADCLGGLLSVVAQNIRMELTAAPGCEIISIKTKKDVKEIKKGMHYEIAAGDMYGEEERDFLLVVKIRSMDHGEKAAFSPLDCRITYANVLESTLANQDLSLVVQRLKCLPALRDADSHLLCQKNRISAAEAMEEATKSANAGDFSSPQITLNSAREQIVRTLDVLAGDHKAQMKVLVDELEEAHKDVSSRVVYFGSGGGKKLAARTQMHYTQRNNVASVIEVSSVACDAAQGHSRATTYRGSRKMKMMKKAFSSSSSK